MWLVGFCFTPMLNKMTIEYRSTSDFARRPLAWLQLIAKNGGTVAFSPSFGYDLCARRAANGAAADLDLSRWRVAGIGGEMVRADLPDRFAEMVASTAFRPSTVVPSYAQADSPHPLSFTSLNADCRCDPARLRSYHTDGEPAQVGTATGRDGM